MIAKAFEAFGFHWYWRSNSLTLDSVDILAPHSFALGNRLASRSSVDTLKCLFLMGFMCTFFWIHGKIDQIKSIDCAANHTDDNCRLARMELLQQKNLMIITRIGDRLPHWPDDLFPALHNSVRPVAIVHDAGNWLESSDWLQLDSIQRLSYDNIVFCRRSSRFKCIIIGIGCVCAAMTCAHCNSIWREWRNGCSQSEQKNKNSKSNSTFQRFDALLAYRLVVRNCLANAKASPLMQ